MLINLGSVIMLSTFALLLSLGLFAGAKALTFSAADYLSTEKRLQRRLLFMTTQKHNIERLFYFRTIKLNFFRQQKIKQLSDKDNQQHLDSLSQSIHKNLLSVKKNIPEATFRQLLRETKHHKNRQDMEALLNLQQKISAFD